MQATPDWRGLGRIKTDADGEIGETGVRRWRDFAVICVDLRDPRLGFWGVK